VAGSVIAETIKENSPLSAERASDSLTSEKYATAVNIPATGQYGVPLSITYPVTNPAIAGSRRGRGSSPGGNRNIDQSTCTKLTVNRATASALRVAFM
jgi:hypothetical protein